MSRTHRYFAAAALTCLVSIAHAGNSDCEELKQPGLIEQRDKCVAHAPCSFVLDSKPDCGQAKAFLERTKGGTLSQLTSLFNRPKPLSSNDVYEANLPEVSFAQDWKDRFAAIRKKVGAAGTEVQTGKNNDGLSWMYQGDVREGKRDGWGIFFWSNGMMYRGQFDRDWRTGQGEYSSPTGARSVGGWEKNRLHGEAWDRLRNGAQRKGSFANGKLEGAGSYLFPEGNLYSGNFVGDNFNGRGIYRWADGSSFEGNFTDDKMDGQGTYTSAAGQQSPRTYANGKIVADATVVAEAPVSPAAACNNSMKTCTTVCTVTGVFGILASGGRGDTSSSQQCIDNCTSKHQQCLADLNPGAAPAAGPGAGGAGQASSGGTLRWPNEGGIEQWAGFTRPSGCAPDLYYIKPMYDAVNAKIGMTIEFSETRNFYESPTVANFVKNPQALGIMQRDLDNFAKIGTDAREAATSVTKVSSGGETSAAIINQIRALQFNDLQCRNAAASGMRAQYFCAAAIKLVELTHRVEGMIQMACRMRVATPTYQSDGYQLNAPAGGSSPSAVLPAGGTGGGTAPVAAASLPAGNAAGRPPQQSAPAARPGASAPLPPLASGTSGGSGAPDSSRTRKVHNPAADAKGCTALIQDTDRKGAEISGRLRFVNRCPTAVEFFWCTAAECARDSGNTWTIHVGGGWPVSAPSVGGVRWGACRGANSGGFDKSSQGQRYTCPNLKW